MTKQHRFTVHILLGMLAGFIVGLCLNLIPFPTGVKLFLINDVLQVVGQLFLRLMFLLVVPIVLVSLMCGSSSLGNLSEIGRVGGKSLLLYLLTTALAVTLALIIASIFHVGGNLDLTIPASFKPTEPPTFSETIINLIPKNPFMALTNGAMLQIIVFSLLVGIAIAAVGKEGERFLSVLHSANQVLIKLIMLIMKTVPYGVFFLLAKLFATLGFAVFQGMMLYFVCVLFVLLLQLFGVYALILYAFSRLNPIIFFKKMYSAMLFAFSVSSSNASIPVVLETVETRLGVHNSVASFVIPLGSTINMDGTAVMQGVATVFIAAAYNLQIGLTGYLMVIMMATLASIGTAGVPGVGLITLAMVLTRVGLPVDGVMLIIGIDRLLDMARTAVNISGDSMIALIIAKSERKFSMAIYQDKTR